MISTVIVTFNKLTLLKECLDAVLNQTILPDKIIIIDNNSTDGTKEYLDELAKESECILPVHLNENIGGAGGFNAGIKKAMSFKSDYIWIMDDDTIPTSTALEKLIQAKDDIGENNFSFLASNVRWIDNSPCLMNIPRVLQNWNTLRGYVELEFSSFVSMFINADCVKKIGYPISDFFIWGDDVEYANRLRSILPGYYVDDSVVVHKMAENNRTDILTDNVGRIPRYFYAYRNECYQSRKKGLKDFSKFILFKYVWGMFKISFTHNDHKLLKLKTINKGVWKGFVFNPVIESYGSVSDES